MQQELSLPLSSYLQACLFSQTQSDPVGDLRSRRPALGSRPRTKKTLAAAEPHDNQSLPPRNPRATSLQEQGNAPSACNTRPEQTLSAEKPLIVQASCRPPEPSFDRGDRGDHARADRALSTRPSQHKTPCPGYRPDPEALFTKTRWPGLASPRPGRNHASGPSSKPLKLVLVVRGGRNRPELVRVHPPPGSRGCPPSSRAATARPPALLATRAGIILLIGTPLCPPPSPPFSPRPSPLPLTHPTIFLPTRMGDTGYAGRAGLAINLDSAAGD